MSIEAELGSRVALVTGGASGIGEATCHLLGARGASVAVVDLDPVAAERVAATLCGQGLRALALRADVTDPGAVRAAIQRTVEVFGALHLAVNNAGVPAPKAPVGEIDVADWQRVVGIDLTGVFVSMRWEIPAMLAAGGGAIVNVASILGLNGMAGRAAYAAAKHGVVGLTKSAALDYAEQGLRVNAVAPGYVDTPLLKGRDARALTALGDLHPMCRLAAPQEIAETIAFLLSPRAVFITGETVLVDGGYSAR